MNLYFLVEGETERQVYPAWLKHLCKKLNRVDLPDQVEINNFCLQSGGGYPSIFNHLENAVTEFNELQNIDFLILCIDSDGLPPEEKIDEAKSHIQHLRPQGYELVFVIQHPCIETWFLGNKRVFPGNPQSDEMRAYKAHFDVSKNDPEAMDSLNDDWNVAGFHLEYLRTMLREPLVSEGQRMVTYHKERPIPVMQPTYLDQLVLRTQQTPHLQSLKTFFQFINKINP